jgi:signal transduction histidine kinase
MRSIPENMDSILKNKIFIWTTVIMISTVVTVFLFFFPRGSMIWMFFLLPVVLGHFVLKDRTILLLIGAFTFIMIVTLLLADNYEHIWYSVVNGTMVAEQFRHREIDLELDFNKEINPYPGDIYKFEQVLLNLLTNAKDAIEEKFKGIKASESKRIRIRTRQNDNSVSIEVEDNGIGIKTPDIDKVLMPFFTTKETGKGTGLGLSISYGIIKEMKGTIEISSKRSVGTTVRIILPRNPVKK